MRFRKFTDRIFANSISEEDKTENRRIFRRAIRKVADAVAAGHDPDDWESIDLGAHE